MTRPLLFSAFVMNTASHIAQGLWRDDEGLQRNFNDIELWVDLARTLEAGGFDVMFFADVIGLYGDHRGGWENHVRTGLQIPSNDPSVLISALAAATEHLGFAITSAPLQEHPFNFARRVSTLDHVSKGRVAWNVVTNALSNGARNFGYDDLTEHDERYRWADEYLDVVYKLWEGSWDEGALIQDRSGGIHSDPEKVHKIFHVSERYRVEGPHLVAPSPQRTPLLFQAGSSSTGRDFAARNAEAQFIISPDPESAKALVDDTRRLVAKHGRHPDDLKFFQGLSFVVGSTEEEARRKEAELEEKIDLDAMVSHLGGALGIDLGHYSLDTPLDNIETQGVRSILAWVQEGTPGRSPTVEDLGRLQGRRSRIVGTPGGIADQLARWRDAGVDGVNVVNQTIPGSYKTFIEHVMPVLRARGLARQGYEPGTLRRKIFGQDRLPDRHPAARYRGAFSNTRTIPAQAAE